MTAEKIKSLIAEMHKRSIGHEMLSRRVNDPVQKTYQEGRAHSFEDAVAMLEEVLSHEQ